MAQGGAARKKVQGAGVHAKGSEEEAGKMGGKKGGGKANTKAGKHPNSRRGKGSGGKPGANASKHKKDFGGKSSDEGSGSDGGGSEHEDEAQEEPFTKMTVDSEDHSSEEGSQVSDEDRRLVPQKRKSAPGGAGATPSKSGKVPGRKSSATAVEDDLSAAELRSMVAALQKQVQKVRGLPAGPGECVALPAARPRLISNRVREAPDLKPGGCPGAGSGGRGGSAKCGTEAGPCRAGGAGCVRVGARGALGTQAIADTIPPLSRHSSSGKGSKAGSRLPARRVRAKAQKPRETSTRGPILRSPRRPSTTRDA